MSRRAAHRRIRLFLHTGDDGSGCRGNSRRPLYGPARHGQFPNGRELSRVPTLSAARARADARVKTPGRGRPAAGPHRQALWNRGGGRYFAAHRGLAVPGPLGETVTRTPSCPWEITSGASTRPPLASDFMWFPGQYPAAPSAFFAVPSGTAALLW